MRRATTWPLAVAFWVLAAPDLEARGQGAETQAEAADEGRERKVLERFLAVLEKAPRRGTALDRVYGYHVERGTLDGLVQGYRDKVTKDPRDGASWLLLGLIEAQRGRDAAAVEAFRQAEGARPDDPIAAFYLGQALVLVGQPDGAVEAFERALGRKPGRADLLEVYQALGRVHQRAHREDKALDVWNRLEKAFPDDPRVQEQIAHALADEGQDAPALARFEGLARAGRDQYRKVQFAIEAADLKVRLGRSTDALADYEKLLAQLDPESWLYREVRRKVEDVFLRTDDLAGLANYYERWLKKVPDDVEAMARLGRTLAGQGRSADSRRWFDQAVKLAPTRRELRVALIEQLAQERRYADAAVQYEALAKAEPNNPDVVRDWGRMILRDTARPEADRKAAAAAVWRRLAPPEAKDAVAVAQAADLFRQAGMTDEAIALYQRAIGLAPDSSQYREYLGEYYHSLKRTADALATWRLIAAGPGRNARTLGRLGEVLAGFGYRLEAVDPLAEACRLAPDDFDLRVRLADLRLALDQPAEALAELDRAARFAAADEQVEAVVDRQIKAYQAAGTLGATTEALALDLKGKPTAAGWTRLARFLEADGKPTEAARAIAEATVIDPRSVPAWVATARLREAAGDLLGAAEAFRALTRLDRRSRTDYLIGIAKLESRLGRKAEALAAGRDLLAASPGNAEHGQFFAELCFGLGETNEGLDALRRSARANPSDPKSTITLAENLARQFRAEEAIELFWRAFARTPDIEGKAAIVARLSDQYLQRNQLDRLFARLERELREPNQQRELAFCLAQAHASSGDFSTARQELDRLLATNPRDGGVLGQLAGLAEQEGDFAGASKYLKQALDIAPSPEGESRLAQLYLRSGEYAEAESLWTRISGGEGDPARALAAIDSLLLGSKRDAALAITARLLRDRPNDWELLYREGVALAGLGRSADADRRFAALLALPTADDDKAASLRSKGPGPGGNGARAAGVPSSQGAGLAPGRLPPLPIQGRLDAWPRIVQAAAGDQVTGQGGSAPADFGQARIYAIAWRLNQSRRADATEAFLAGRRQARDKAPADPRALWDWFLLARLRGEGPATLEASRALADRLPNDLASQWAYLETLAADETAGAANPPGRAAIGQGSDPVPALAAPMLDRALAAYRAVQGRRPDLAPLVLGGVLGRLKRADRPDDAARIYRETMDAARPDGPHGAALIAIAVERGDTAGLLGFLDKLERARAAGSIPAPSPAMTAAQLGTTTPARIAAQAIACLVAARAYPEALGVLDRALAANTRARVKGQGGRPAAAAPRRNAQGNGNNTIVNSWQNGTAWQSMGLDFPAPDAHFDLQALSLLRTAFDLFRRDDQLGDLFDLLGRKAEAAVDAERVDLLLAQGILRWWNDEKEDAARLVARAVDTSAAADPAPLMMLATLHELRSEPAEALASLDAIESVDAQAVQARETQALRLAAASGDVDRARKAAERLFGLRLDSEAQVQLASMMQQLGMRDLADAVLARARRSAGNRPPSLAVLMNQYQAQGKPDQALPIALQILRLRPNNSSPAGAPQPGTNVMTTTVNATGQRIRTVRNNIGNNAMTADDVARQQAVQVVVGSGKMKDLIARAEAQLERSPNSMQVLGTLAEYAQVAGDRPKTIALYGRMAKARPDDIATRLQVAAQLMQAGAAAEAAEQYRAAIRLDPRTLATQLYPTLNAFRQAGQVAEFGALAASVDPRLLGPGFGVTNLAQALMNEPGLADGAKALFRRLWAGSPSERAGYLAILGNSPTWLQDPEFFGYLRDSVIPPEGAGPLPAWAHVERIQVLNNNNNGFLNNNNNANRVTLDALRLLEAASGLGKLDDLAGDVRRAIGRHPEWKGGDVLLAMTLLRSGRFEEVRAIVGRLAAEGAAPIPLNTLWVLGQELDDHSPVRDLAGPLYERAMALALAKPGLDLNNAEDPSARLLAWYGATGRPDAARDLILKLARAHREAPGLIPAQSEANRIFRMGNYAWQLVQLGEPADAIRLYRDQVARAEALLADPASRSYLNMDQLRLQAQQGVRQAIDGAKAEAKGLALAALFEPSAGSGPALDLGIAVPSPDLAAGRVEGTLIDTIRQVSGPGGIPPAITANLAALAEKYPDDPSVGVAGACFAFEPGQPGGPAPAVDRLVALVDRRALAPLGPPGPDGRPPRPTLAQRAEAARWLGLWLAARRCWAAPDPALRTRGDRLAARALEAATRQADPHFATAMLREWGQSELDRGDREAAERRWGELLARILPSPRAASAATAPQVVRVGRKPAGRPSGPATPADAFDSALALARMAADRGLTALSVRAAREAFRDGAPAGSRGGLAASNNGNARVLNTPRTGLAMRNGAGGDPASAGGPLVDRLGDLASAWDRGGVDPLDVYRFLKDVVFPPTRPGEIDLYPAPFAPKTIWAPRSLGGNLVARAVRLGKADEVRTLASGHRITPVAELSALVVETEVALGLGEAGRAAEALGRIADQLRVDTLRVSAELGVLAALPACRVPGAEDRADAVLDAATASLAAQGNVEPLATLLLALAGRDLGRNRPDPARKRYDDYVAIQRKAAAANNNPAYAALQAKLAIRRVAAEYAGRGRAVDAFDHLGRAADIAAFDQSENGFDLPLIEALRGLDRLPAPERYRILKAWSDPTKARRTVRLLAALERGPGEPPPASSGATPAPAPTPEGAAASTIGRLVAAAAEAGRLDELAAEARGLADSGFENADALLVLVELARGRGDDARAAVDAMAESWAALLAVPNNQVVAPPAWGPFLASRAGLRDDRLRPSAEPLADVLSRWFASPYRQRTLIDQAISARLGRDREQAAVDLAAGRDRPIGRDPGLASWAPLPASRPNQAGDAGAAAPAWVEAGGIVGLSSPSTSDALGFAIPLLGRFEFSAEIASTPGEGEALLSYGGQEFGSRFTGQNQVPPHQPNGSTVPLAFAPGAPQAFRDDRFNRITLQVEPGRARCLINGHLIAEDRDPGPTSPWVALLGSGRGYWRDFAISGSPEVPAHLDLNAGGRLEGWSAWPGETIEPVAAASQDGSAQGQPGGYDWSARTGTIEGRRVDASTTSPAAQGRLGYDRPLGDGESVSFEFRHEPGKFEVHPSLGRLAFLLEPGGVRLHWITAGVGASPGALAADNAFDEPEGRRGDGPIALKAGDWNLAKVAIAGGKVAVEVNGRLAFERAVAPGDDRTFGLFHFKDRSAATVRNVVLRGDWKARFEAAKRDGLLARDRPGRDGADRRADHALLGEAISAGRADEVLRATRGLAPEPRFDALAAWVLPAADRPTFRVAGRFSPLDPPPPEGDTPGPGSAPARSLRGGDPESPATDLVAVARDLGRLDALADRVEAAPAPTTADARGRLALLAIARAAQGRDDAASAALAKLRDLAGTTRPGDPDWTRWPELLASLATSDRPALNAAAAALLVEPEATANQVQGVDDFWLRQVHRALSVARMRALGESADDPPPIPGWATVQRARMTMRGAGYPRSAWVVRDGEFHHASGLRGDALILKTPLLGDFTVDCELTTRAGGEAAFNYGGWLIRPDPSGGSIMVQQDDAVQPQVSLTSPLDLKAQGGWAATRLALKGDRLTLTINGRLVFDRTVAIDADPWLILQATGPLGAGARNFRIGGRPVVPEKIRISDGPGLAGWTATEFEELMVGDAAAWRKRGDEIVGRRAADPSANLNGFALPSAAPAAAESVLRYRRPMLEDGTISYEFLHDPGKTGVHPSLGRLAFLIEAEGVSIHRLTDGIHDRSGLDPGNASAEPACRRGPASPPLRPGEWNRVALAIRGDVATITLNGTLIYERPIEPTNQRGFGLFHRDDRTEARVRAVTFEGDWPRVPPALAR